jgi:hypothetical protein
MTTTMMNHCAEGPANAGTTTGQNASAPAPSGAASGASPASPEPAAAHEAVAPEGDVDVVTPCTCRGEDAGKRVAHRLAEPSKWPWLPTQGNGVLAQHPWCKDCGLVKTVGAERARDFGGLVNLLGALQRRLEEHGYRVTEAQKRLIVKKLRELEADDTFALTRVSQERALTQVVSRYLGLTPETVDTYLHSC